MTVKVEFSINNVELQVKYLHNPLMRREFVCVRHSISKLEPITGRKSETAITTKYRRLAHRQNYKKIAIPCFFFFCFCLSFSFLELLRLRV